MILLWKVDLRVIVNSPSCLSLDSQVTDQILIYAFDKRCFLTSEIDLRISLYSLGRSGSDTEPSSTEGSSWMCSGKPEVGLELRNHGLVLTLYTPLLRLSSSFLATGLLPFYGKSIWVRGWFRGVFLFLPLCLLLLLEGIWGSLPLGFWLLDGASSPDSWASGFLELDTLLWFLKTSWHLQVSLGFYVFLFLPLVVFRTLVGLPDSCWSSGFLLVFRTLVGLPDSFSHLDSLSLYILVKTMWFFQRRE